jgi:hypothetical protein
MIKDNQTQLNNHRTMANVYLRAADAYKALGNKTMYVAKMSEYEKEMRKVVQFQIAVAREVA